MTFRIRPFTNYRAFSLTWPASMQIYWNKRKLLHKKRVQLPEDILGTPMWPPRRHVKTLYSKAGYKDLTEPNVHMHVPSYQLKAQTNTPTNSFFFCSFILYVDVQKSPSSDFIWRDFVASSSRPKKARSSRQEVDL